MIAGFVEPDCKPDGFEESVALAARGTCILKTGREATFFCPSAQGPCKDHRLVEVVEESYDSPRYLGRAQSI